jgi:hypothetical protein
VKGVGVLHVRDVADAWQANQLGARHAAQGLALRAAGKELGADRRARACARSGARH